MPVLTVSTNALVWDGVVVSSVVSELSQQISCVTGKPESYVMVLLNCGVPMYFAGSEELAAYAELVSIGGLTPDINRDLCLAISEVLKSRLSVPPSRCYIKFHDMKEQSELVSCLHALHQ